MSFQQLLLMALVILADLSSSYATTPDCPSLQPIIHVTIFPTLDDVQRVTSKLQSTRTVFTTEGVNVTTHHGQEVFVTETAATTAYVTSTVLHRVTVNVSQVGFAFLRVYGGGRSVGKLLYSIHRMYQFQGQETFNRHR